MEYELIQLPNPLEVRQMSRADLKKFFDSFVARIPQRLALLDSVVNGSHGFNSWHADFTENSLMGLGEWFVSHVETRPRSDVEKQAIAAKSPYPIEIPNEELTDKTFSLAVDVGIYFAETLRRHLPNLSWDMAVKDKRDVDYGYPLVKGSGDVPLNPVQIVTNIAYGVVSKKFGGGRLKDLYNVWKRSL